MGNGKFSEIASVAQVKSPSFWNKISFFVLDLPTIRKPYSERKKMLLDMSKNEKTPWPTHLQVITDLVCEGSQHLNAFFTNVLQKGGEGVILRNPKSLYETGRSDSFYKLKVSINTRAF
jgi:DNA ligase-1